MSAGVLVNNLFHKLFKDMYIIKELNTTVCRGAAVFKIYGHHLMSNITINQEEKEKEK